MLFVTLVTGFVFGLLGLLVYAVVLMGFATAVLIASDLLLAR